MHEVRLKPGDVIRSDLGGPAIAVLAKGLANGDALLIMRDHPEDSEDAMRERARREGAAVE